MHCLRVYHPEIPAYTRKVNLDHADRDPSVSSGRLPDKTTATLREAVEIAES